MKKSVGIKTAAFGLFVLICGQVGSVSAAAPDETENRLPEWALGGFVRPANANPVILPDPQIRFFCPMRKDSVGWMESDTFNPAAVVRNGEICILFRAEDNSATGIGKRTSRIGLARSHDGTTMRLDRTPVLFPDEDSMKTYDWPGGCEDPRVTVTEDGTYVMLYTSWNRDIPRLSVATSRDLTTWTKHGPAFAKAYDGRFRNLKSKSGSIVTKLDGEKLVIARVNGKYLMYWGERMVNIATSDNLIDWTPELDANGNLKGVVFPRAGYFDSALTECGPPAVLTDKGILLLYNGQNRLGEGRDKRYPARTYAAGQILFDAQEPGKVIGRLDTPFFRPTDDFEKSGQYKDGTVFIEGLVFFKSRWYLYYGCADSRVGVAVYDPTIETFGDPIPQVPQQPVQAE
ncbi:MAG: glycoside hydrolase family 130 protein [Alistipes sp.]|nr:glycoside hydrolase family 130 protein [Alistipes sp.]